MLISLAKGISGPWLIVGDFNYVDVHDERIGSRSRIRDQALYVYVQSLRPLKDSLLGLKGIVKSYT